MTYIEFYQAWLELMMQNAQIGYEHGFSCIRYRIIEVWIWTFYVIDLLIFGFSFDKILNKDKTIKYKIKLTVFLCFLALFTYKLDGYRKFISNQINTTSCRNYSDVEPHIWFKYPESDYTLEEFKQNMAILSPSVSSEKIKLANTVIKNCLELISDNYDVKHSSLIRSCINNKDTRNIFEKKDAEIYKNKYINELNQN